VCPVFPPVLGIRNATERYALYYSIVKWNGLEGSTIKRLYNKTILETNISLPSTREQSQIGTFFNHIDSLIILQQRELDKLKNIKKACLEKMFV